MMSERWIKIGECGVDSGTMMLIDPCYLDEEEGFNYEEYCDLWSEKFQDHHIDYKDLGVAFTTGYGDGLYSVYALISDDGMWGDRVKEVKIVFIEDDE